MNTVAEMTTDDHYPRNPANRYRIYRQRDGELTILGTSPDAGGIGQGIVAWHEDGDLLPMTDQLGVMDCAGEDGRYESGTWIVNPFARGSG